MREHRCGFRNSKLSLARHDYLGFIKFFENTPCFLVISKSRRRRSDAYRERETGNAETCAACRCLVILN